MFLECLKSRIILSTNDLWYSYDLPVLLTLSVSLLWADPLTALEAAEDCLLCCDDVTPPLTAAAACEGGEVPSISSLFHELGNSLVFRYFWALSTAVSKSNGNHVTVIIVLLYTSLKEKYLPSLCIKISSANIFAWVQIGPTRSLVQPKCQIWWYCWAKLASWTK